MANRKTRNSMDKSNRSEHSFITGETESEHFWSAELNAEKRSFTWTPDAELEDDDQDFVDHTLFLRQVVLGVGSTASQENIVRLESMGAEGEPMKGVIANLTKGVNTMSPLELTIPGKCGATFTLAEGDGPICINGSLFLEFPRDAMTMDQSQTESELSEGAEDEEEEEEVELKTVKRKGAKLTNGKDKQKAKMEVEDAEDDEDDEDDEIEDEDDEDDEDFEEEEEDPTPKKTKKKAADVKAKATKEAKPVKNGKKAKAPKK